MRKKLLFCLMISVTNLSLADNYSRTPYFNGQKPLITGFYPNPAVNPQTNATTAVADLIVQNQVQNGFSANDPRITTTLRNAGSSIVGGVAGAAGGTAVSATCLGLTIGIGSFGCAALGMVAMSVVSYAVTSGLNALLGWIFNSDGSISTAGSKIPKYMNGPYSSGQSVTIGLGQDCMPLQLGGIFLGQISGVVPFNYTCANYAASPPLAAKQYTMSANLLNGQATSINSNPNIGAVISSLTPAQSATTLNPQTLAGLANAALAASQNVPGSLPFNQSNPITAAQAVVEIAAMGTNAPTVGDMFSTMQTGQIANASAAFTPSSALTASNSTPTTPVVDPGAGTAPGVSTPVPPTTPPINVNLGADPGIGAPNLETPPDGPTIMSPLLSGLSPYMSFSVAMPAGVCPAPTFDFRPVWQKQIPSTVICTLYDSVSQKIFMVMTLAWSICFLLIVLKA